MYKAKVNQTQKYRDSQGEHIVCEGKLVLLKNKKPPADVYVNNRGYHPIIISETEKIEVGDWVLLQVNENKAITKVIEVDNNGGIKSEDGLWRRKSIYSKILALPQHFSDKHLQAIVDEKMKNNDKVLVKCYTDNTKWGSGPIKKIYLDQQNHITLFSAQQSLEKAAKDYYHNNLQERGSDYFKAGALWAAENNYKED